MSQQSYNDSSFHKPLYVLIGNSTSIRAACPSPPSVPSSIQQLSASPDVRCCIADTVHIFADPATVAAAC